MVSITSRVGTGMLNTGQGKRRPLMKLFDSVAVIRGQAQQSVSMAGVVTIITNTVEYIS